MPLHLSKVAVGCDSIDLLAERTRARTVDGIAEITTRFRPTRHIETEGGSLYWIIKHRLVARQGIIGYRELETERRWAILLQPDLVLVRQRFKRVHQGWRYLEHDACPEDLVSRAGSETLPPHLAAELEELALL